MPAHERTRAWPQHHGAHLCQRSPWLHTCSNPMPRNCRSARLHADPAAPNFDALGVSATVHPLVKMTKRTK
eukprot:442975-Pleurochrysis_carterae.AAC.1